MITKLLIANRGEIARRIAHTARAMGISCVAVASDADRHAPHTRDADEVVRLPGSAPADTYLRTDLLVAAALAAGADAVHPGYGFLSENAAFARACHDAGLTFVGPPAEVIEAMGSKLEAKRIMEAAGVPVLPTVAVPPEATEGSVPGAVADQAAALGWPVIVKASAGGGGRGMRVVDGPHALADALATAAREAAAAFGDGTLFLEPYVPGARHVEVQILGDIHGSVLHLFERECSIQRRHQKIVEEAPSPAVDRELRAALGGAAVTAAKAIGYVNAGTVEFLLLPDGRFAFLEVNTRLQVEHPVTEAVSGVDLVRLQLLIAEGQRLPPELHDAAVTGHAIEVRLYAEDPTHAWRPSAGRLQCFEVPARPFAVSQGYGVRVDSGVEAGTDVGTSYDPLLAKVIAHAPTRAEAARALAATLARARLHGLVTNRQLLVRILQHPEFLAGQLDTAFLERHDPAVLGNPALPEPIGRLHAVAAALAGQARRRAAAPVLRQIPSGWRNNPSGPQVTELTGLDGRLRVGYRFDRRGRCVELQVDDEPLPDVEVLAVGPQMVELSFKGLARRYRVCAHGATWEVDGPDGSSTFTEVERFSVPGTQLAAGSLTAPLPGTVVEVKVRDGDVVSAGDVLVTVEAMKMEHEVRAPEPGTVRHVHVAPGDQVDAGKLLLVVEEAKERTEVDR